MSENVILFIASALLAVFGAVFTFAFRYVLNDFTKKVENLAADVAGKWASITAEIRANNDDAEARCVSINNGVGGRVDGVIVDMGQVQHKLNSQGERLASLESKVAGMPTTADVTHLREDISNVQNSLGRVEGKMEYSAKSTEDLGRRMDQILDAVLQERKP